MQNNFTQQEAAGLAASPLVKDALRESDYKSLLESFITKEFADLARPHRVKDHQGREIVGQSHLNCEGIDFPYFNEFGEIVAHTIRRDYPEKDEKGKPQRKYIAEKGFRNPFYLAPGTTPVHLQNIDLPLVFTEGPKKGLALFRLSEISDLKFLPIALAGVANIKTSAYKRFDESGSRESYKDFVADFQKLKLYDEPTGQQRIAYILFDSNCRIEVNPNVFFARIALASYLKLLNAKVLLIDLPVIEGLNGEILNGIDDVLGFYAKRSIQAAIDFAVKLFDQAKEYQANVYHLSNNLTVKVESGDRNKTRLIVSRESVKLHLDEINLNESAKRLKFIDNCKIEKDEQTELNHFLINLVDNLPAKAESQTVTAEKFTLSEVLSDGRIIEALSTGEFAVYDPETDSVEYAKSVTAGGTCYKPLVDSISKEFLVDSIEKYENEKLLVEEIKTFIQNNYSLDSKECEYAAYFILLTHIQDRLRTVPYIHLLGKPGSGKSRLGETVIAVSYHGFFSHSITSASLYRLITKYGFLTLFLDEFNLSDSDDAQEIIKILNAGWHKKGFVTRTNSLTNEAENFTPFGCKIIASLKKLQSDALESRCIDIKTRELEVKEAEDLNLNEDSFNEILQPDNEPLFVDVGQIEEGAAILKRKLLMYRLRNLHRDFKQEFIQANLILRKYGIRGRGVQKSAALFAIITDIELKRDFIRSLKAETKITRQLTEQTFEAEVIGVIHNILFDCVYNDDNELESVSKRHSFNGRIIKDKIPYFLILDVVFDEGKVCPALAVENIVLILNEVRQGKSEISTQGFGRTLIKDFNLETEKVKTASNIRDKRAVIFNGKVLSELFNKYNLPISADFNVPNVPKDDKPLENHNLTNGTFVEKSGENQLNVPSIKDNNNNGLRENGTFGTFVLPKPFGNSKKVTREI